MLVAKCLKVSILIIYLKRIQFIPYLFEFCTRYYFRWTNELHVQGFERKIFGKFVGVVRFIIAYAAYKQLSSFRIRCTKRRARPRFTITSNELFDNQIFLPFHPYLGRNGRKGAGRLDLLQ